MGQWIRKMVWGYRFGRMRVAVGQAVASGRSESEIAWLAWVSLESLIRYRRASGLASPWSGWELADKFLNQIGDGDTMVRVSRWRNQTESGRLWSRSVGLPTDPVPDEVPDGQVAAGIKQTCDEFVSRERRRREAGHDNTNGGGI
jgi:hypothetical protein